MELASEEIVQEIPDPIQLNSGESIFLKILLANLETISSPLQLQDLFLVA